MLELNRIDVLPGAADPAESTEHRWTNYLSVRLPLSQSQLLLQDTLYFQPRWDDFSDFRALQELEVMAKVTDVLALGAVFSVVHDSTPPTGVVPTDLQLATTVRVTL